MNRHAIAGVYTELADGGVAFHPLPPPTDDEIAALAARIAGRTARIFAHHDATAGDDEPADALAAQLPLALSSRHADLALPTRRSLYAVVDGFSLHAATFVPPHDRGALERLLRYILRPAVAAERISLRADGSSYSRPPVIKCLSCR